MAQAPASDTGAAPQLSAEDLDNLVGRIALYPDDLVAIILPGVDQSAAIVQADRFLDKRKTDPKLPIDEKWDDSVKALVNYPDVVKMMSGDLDWTSALGEAVVADQGAVLEAIQAFRRRAAGRGQSQEQRQAGRRRREDGDRDRSRQSGSDLRAAVQPDDGRRRGCAGLGLLPHAVPRLLLPVSRRAPRSRRGSSGAPRSAPRGAAPAGAPIGAAATSTSIATRTSTPATSTGATSTVASAVAAAGAGRCGNTAWKSDKQPGQVSGATGRTNTGARVGDARAGGGGGFSGAGAGARVRPRRRVGRRGRRRGGRGRQSSVDATFGRLAAVAAPRTARAPSARRRATTSADRAHRAAAPASGSGLGGYGSGRQTSMDSSRGASSRSSMSAVAAAADARGRGGGGGGRGGGGGGGRGGGGRR